LRAVNDATQNLERIQTMTNRALIIIDIQNDYFPGGKWELDQMDTAAETAASVLAAARAAGDLIVHVHHVFPTVEAPFFVPNSKGAEIHKSMEPGDGEAMVKKHHINAFRDTNLKTILDENSITDVTIIGAMSHMCIDAAVRAAADFGYIVTVVEDACACRDLEFKEKTIPASEVHAAYMSALGFAYATVTTAADYLEATTRAA